MTAILSAGVSYEDFLVQYDGMGADLRKSWICYDPE